MAAKRPAQLRLGFALWRISWDRRELDKIRLAERDPHIQGFCDAARQVIVVETGSPASERLRLTHEILHACVATADNFAPAIATAELTEEELVRDAAPWLLEALVQNPDLLSWLVDG